MFQGIEKHPCVFSEDCQKEQGDSAGGDDGAQAKAEEAFSRQVVGHCPGERTKDACQHGETALFFPVLPGLAWIEEVVEENMCLPGELDKQMGQDGGEDNAVQLVRGRQPDDE